MQKTIEVWRQIQKWGGLYSVSNYGRIMSRHTKSKGGIISAQVHNGYHSLKFCYEQKQTRVGIHRLVAEAFHPNPRNLPCVNHIDGNPSNNYWENLEWCTHQENMQHAYQTGLNPGPGRGPTHAQSKPVQCIETGVIYSCLQEAAKATGCDFSDISKVCRGIKKKCKDLTWRYV